MRLTRPDHIEVAIECLNRYARRHPQQQYRTLGYIRPEFLLHNLKKGLRDPHFSAQHASVIRQAIHVLEEDEKPKIGSSRWMHDLIRHRMMGRPYR